MAEASNPILPDPNNKFGEMLFRWSHPTHPTTLAGQMRDEAQRLEETAARLREVAAKVERVEAKQ